VASESGSIQDSHSVTHHSVSALISQLLRPLISKREILSVTPFEKAGATIFRVHLALSDLDYLRQIRPEDIEGLNVIVKGEGVKVDRQFFLFLEGIPDDLGVS
jgi:5-formaminoimidazole-4-carboxamide-1-beta-D-ribofuranosyl 5'-monophosphate synthetase